MSTLETTLLLGTNLGNKKNNLASARSFITHEIGPILKEGNITETVPVEFTSSNLFLNQLIRIETNLSPIQLLTALKSIEAAMGRTYDEPLPYEKYTSRIIDIDILIMGNIIYNSQFLNIPHYQINTRLFVQEMLAALKSE